MVFDISGLSLSKLVRCGLFRLNSISCGEKVYGLCKFQAVTPTLEEAP